MSCFGALVFTGVTVREWILVGSFSKSMPRNNCDATMQMLLNELPLLTKVKMQNFLLKYLLFVSTSGTVCSFLWWRDNPS